MAIHLSDYEKGTPHDGDYRADLEALQKRVAHLQVAHTIAGQRTIILFEGWDAAGKGGAIQRLTAEWDPRNYEVWPIAAPTEAEKARHFLWRFWTRLPGRAGIAVFDRSWYGRVLVERVEGFASEREWRRAYDEINEFEAQLKEDGTNLIKLFLHIREDTQDKRLRRRLQHPWKRWKVNAEDFRNRARRADYLAAMRDMFEYTDTRWAPWTVIDGNDKKAARLAVLSTVVERMERAVPAAPPPADPVVARLAREQMGIETD